MIEKSQKVYSKQEVEKATLNYFKNDELATDVWIKKYCLKDEKNYYELTPDDMHRRIAKELARIEAKYPNPINEDQIYETLKNFKYIIPQGSPMSGIGNDFQVSSLSNCFVIGPQKVNGIYEDSYGSILKIDQEIIQLSKRRAGVGTTLEHIRPEGTTVKNAALTSTGIIPFMERYSNSIREVAQCLHPDTLILTENGLVRIKNINIGDKVWTENGFVSVNNVLTNKKKLVKLYTKYGNEIICSEDHVFHTINGEKPLKDINIGEEISIIIGNNGWIGKDINLNIFDVEINSYNNSNRINNDVTLPTILDEDLAYYLGYSYGDGYVEKDNYLLSLALSNDWSDIKTKLVNIIKKLFNYDVSITKGDGDCENCKICSKIIINHLEKNNFLKEKTNKILFPEILFTAKKEIIFSFLSGYFDADGSYLKSKKNFKFTSINKEFLLNTQRILYSFGIISKIHSRTREKENVNWKEIHDLTINGYQSQKIFIDLMKSSIKISTSNHIKQRKSFIRSVYMTKDFNTKSYYHKYIMDDKQYITYATCERLCEELKIENKYRLFQDYILKIEKYSETEEDVLDLVLDSEYLFFANCLYVHNSGRRGALLLSTHINSIDCELFIDAKIDTKKVTGANISIKIDDEFMDALNNNKKYIQKFPIKSNNPILQKEIDPKIIWNKLMKNNWLSAEPGILFIDNILRESVADCYSDLGFETIGVNPCGEITLCNSDSCRLLLLNLYSFVEKPFTVEAYFNEKVFIETVKIAQKYMDDIVDLELEKIKRIIEKIESDPESDETKRIEKNLWLRIKDKCIKGRRTGTGITGEGDMLAALGFRYGTKDATNFSVYVHKLLAINSYISSAEMARDRGTFPIFKFEKEINNPFVNRLYNDSNELFELTKKYGRRNISLLTISPAGSVSILTQTTSGIEPLFLPYYKRRKKINPNDKNSKIAFVDEIGDSWEEYFVFHKKFKIWAEINGYNNIELLNEDFLNKIFEQSPYYKACSNDIDWKECVNMQGAINKYVDHSISKTINLPTDTTVELVDELYRTAHSVGCKGITVYRDKSRNGVLVSIEEKKEEFHDIHAIKRPKRLKAEIHRFQNNLEKWIAVVGIKDNRPYEIFTGKFENGLSNLPNTVKDCEVVKNIIDGIDIDGKPCKIKRYDIEYIDLNGVKQTHIGLNHAFNPEFWNYAKLISGIMRHGMPIIKQFELVDSLNFKEDYINTWKNGVARIIKRYVKDGEKSKGNCPECGGTDFVFAEGCIRCVKCSWSKCG